MATVYVRENESIESALKRFKKQVIKEGTLKEYRERQYYVSKGEKNRAALKAARRKTQLETYKMNNRKEY